MPQNPLDGRAISQLPAVPDLLATDRLAVLRPTAPDPLDQNVTVAVSRLTQALLAVLTPAATAAVLAVLAPLLAGKADLNPATGLVVASQLPPVTFATTQGSPLDNPLLAALFLANGQYVVRSYADAQQDISDEQLQSPKLYRLENRPADPAIFVLVQALTSTSFNGADAYTQDSQNPTGPLLPVSYDFATDTASPRTVTLPVPAELTTNALRGGGKLVDYLAPFAGMAPFYTTLASLPESGLVVGVRALVQNPAPAPADGSIVASAYYVLARCRQMDPGARLAYINGGGASTTIRTWAQWVPEVSPAGQAAYFEYFETAGRPLTHDYPLGWVVKYVEGGRLNTYEVFPNPLVEDDFLAQALPGIPAPGGANNAYWRPYAAVTPPPGTYLTLTVAAAQGLADDPFYFQAVTYHVLRDAAGDVLLAGIPSRPAKAGNPDLPGGFSPTGYWFNPATGAFEFVYYDVPTDTVRPFAAAAAFADVTGAPRDNGGLADEFAIIDAHRTNTNNPHAVTASQVGLGQATNTSDSQKVAAGPIANALNAETQARQLGDTTLLGAINANGTGIAANTAAIAANAAAIATEVTARTSGDAATLASAAAYTDLQTMSVRRLAVADIDASTNPATFPTTGGTGTGGAIRRGDQFYISTAGTLAGVAVEAGDAVEAVQASPSSTNAAHWRFIQANLFQATEGIAGTARLVTTAIAQNENTTDDARQMTALKSWQLLARFVAIARNISGLWNFTTSPTVPNATAAGQAAAFGQIPTAGTGGGNYAAGNDSRLSDARTTTWASVRGLVSGAIAAVAGTFASADTLEVWLGKLLTLVNANTANITNAQKLLPFTTQTGTTYTLTSADFGTVVRFTSNSPVTVTVPAGLGTGIGEHVEIAQAGTGIVTLAFASGVTPNALPAGATKTPGQHGSLYLHCRPAANTWNIANAIT